MNNRNKIICKLFNGYKIFAYHKEECITKHLMKYTCWEPEITSIMFKILNKDSVFFDVGTFIGYYPIVLHSNCKKIHCFDINHNNILRLNNSIDMNNIKNIIVNNYAVSDRSDEYFCLENRNTKNLGSLKTEMPTKNDLRNLIKSISIDDYIETNNIDNIDLIKIDVEGYELKCLYGLENSIKKQIISNFIIEITPLWGVPDSIKILQYLCKYKYRIFDIPIFDSKKFSVCKTLYNPKNFEDIDLSSLNEVHDINKFINMVLNRIGQTNILATISS